MMRLYINWQDQKTRRWYTVGELSHKDNNYIFHYTQGALSASNVGFIPFGALSDIKKSYNSAELFPLFANRILSKSRPEYSDYLKWMDIIDENPDPLMILSRSGGERATDNVQVYPAPEKTKEGRYETYFFVHGIRYMPKETIDLIESIEVGQKLYPMHDFANPHDSNALSLRTGDPAFMVGYCPRYLSPDIKHLTDGSSKEINIIVKKINKEAPIQMRVLCKFDTIWPDGFQCRQDECALINS